MFSVSTIPSTGFMERLAMPVLNDMDGMSRMAVPVVSEPVPAVVGTGGTIRIVVYKRNPNVTNSQ